jgi:hypothetical protein
VPCVGCHFYVRYGGFSSIFDNGTLDNWTKCDVAFLMVIASMINLLVVPILFLTHMLQPHFRISVRSVSTMARLSPEELYSIPGKITDFSLNCRVQTGYGAHPTS